MVSKKKSIPINKLLKYLAGNGTIATAEWYATELDMPIKKAQYMVAYRVFKEYEEDDEFDDSMIDVMICRFLWQKYIGDKEIAEIISKVLPVDKFQRNSEIGMLLYDLNIKYPQKDFIINAIYFVFPELRTADTSSCEDVMQVVSERLSISGHIIRMIVDNNKEVAFSDIDTKRYSSDNDNSLNGLSEEDDDYEDGPEGPLSEYWYYKY